MLQSSLFCMLQGSPLFYKALNCACYKALHYFILYSFILYSLLYLEQHVYLSAPGGHLDPEWVGNEGESVSEVLRIRG